MHILREIVYHGSLFVHLLCGAFASSSSSLLLFFVSCVSSLALSGLITNTESTLHHRSRSPFRHQGVDGVCIKEPQCIGVQ